MWRTAALIGALLALGSWIAVCLVAQPPRIEVALRVETERALAEAGLRDVRAAVSGRDAALEGRVASPAVLAEAERLVAGVAGIRAVDNRLAVRQAAAEAVPLTHLEISVGPAGVSVRGAVPREALRLEILERARQLYGSGRVDAQLAVGTAVPDGAAMAGAAGVLSALSTAGESVQALLSGDSLRLSGTVVSIEARRRVEQQVRAAAPGVRLFFSALAVSAGGAQTQRPLSSERGGGGS